MQSVNLTPIVDYNKKKVEEVQVEELRVSLTEAVAVDPPHSADEILEMVQQKKKEQALPEAEIIKVSILDASYVTFSHPCVVSKLV